MLSCFILDITELFHGSHGSPTQKTASKCWGPAVLQSSMEQTGCRSLASPATSDCQSLVLQTGPLDLRSMSPAQQKWWECALMEVKSEDPPLEFPTERVRSNDFTGQQQSLVSTMGVAGLCVAKGWASWSESGAGSQQLRAFSSILSIPSQLKWHCEPSLLKENKFYISDRPPWNHSSHHAMKKILCFLPPFEHHLKLHIFIWSWLISIK